MKALYKGAAGPGLTLADPASRWKEAFAVARKGDGGKVIIDWSKE